MRKFGYVILSVFIGLTLAVLSCCVGDDDIEENRSSMDKSSVIISSDKAADIQTEGHSYVDLGLKSGTLWATCNIGADKPEDYGSYFAWGETETKTNYTISKSKTYGLDVPALQNKGIITGKGCLSNSSDVATAMWGEEWRMPTYEEMSELKESCKWIWTTSEGVKGFKVIGPNGNSIFLPASGTKDGDDVEDDGFAGFYWSSTPHKSATNTYSYEIYFTSYELECDYMSHRGNGNSVRPVVSKK